MFESFGLGGVLSFDTGNALPNMGAARKAFGALGGAVDKAKASLSKIGGAFQAAAVPLAGASLAFGGAVKQVSDFGAEIGALRAAGGSEIEGSLQKIIDKSLELGAKTSFSATQAAQGFTNLVKAGMTADQAIDAIQGTLFAAAAEGMDLAQATTIVTATLSQFNKPASAAAEVADTLAKASSASLTSIQDLGVGLKYVGGRANALGIPLQQTTAMLAAVTNAGIDGSTAGTGLASMFTRLIKPVGESADILEQLGFTSDKVFGPDGKLKDPEKVMVDLINGFKRFGKDAPRAIATVFGEEGARAFDALSVTMAQTGKGFTDIGKTLKGARGEAQRMSDVRLDNFSGGIEKVKGSLDTLLNVVLRPAVEGPMKAALGKIENFINAISDRVQNMDPKMRKLVTRLVGGFGIFLAVATPVVAALTSLGFIITTVIIPAAQGLAGVFAAVFTPALIPAIAGIGLLVAGFIIFREKIFAFANGVRDRLQPAIEAFRETWQMAVTSARQWWDNFKFAIESDSASIGINWRQVGRAVGDVLQGVARIALFAFRGVLGFFNFVSAAAAITLKTILDVIRPFWGAISGVLTSFATAWDELFTGNALRGLARFAVAFIDLVLTPFRGFLSLVGKALEVIPGFNKTIVQNFQRGVEAGFASLIPTNVDVSTPAGQAADALAEGERKKNEKDKGVGDKLDKLNKTLEEKDFSASVSTDVKLDGKTLALAVGKHGAEIQEREGFKTTPWSRRLALEHGAVSVGRGRS